MVNLNGAQPNFNEADFHGLREVVPRLVRPRKRLTDLLVKSATEKPTKKQEELWPEGSKQWFLKLLRTPLEILPCCDNISVSGIKLGINELHPKDEWDENQSVRYTGNDETINCGLVLRSIGYKSIGRYYKFRLPGRNHHGDNEFFEPLTSNIPQI